MSSVASSQKNSRTIIKATIAIIIVLILGIGSFTVYYLNSKNSTEEEIPDDNAQTGTQDSEAIQMGTEPAGDNAKGNVIFKNSGKTPVYCAYLNKNDVKPESNIVDNKTPVQVGQWVEFEKFVDWPAVIKLLDKSKHSSAAIQSPASSKHTLVGAKNARDRITKLYQEIPKVSSVYLRQQVDKTFKYTLTDAIAISLMHKLRSNILTLDGLLCFGSEYRFDKSRSYKYADSAPYIHLLLFNTKIGNVQVGDLIRDIRADIEKSRKNAEITESTIKDYSRFTRLLILAYILSSSDTAEHLMLALGINPISEQERSKLAADKLHREQILRIKSHLINNSCESLDTLLYPGKKYGDLILDMNISYDALVKVFCGQLVILNLTYDKTGCTHAFFEHVYSNEQPPVNMKTCFLVVKKAVLTDALPQKYSCDYFSVIQNENKVIKCYFLFLKCFCYYRVFPLKTNQYLFNTAANLGYLAGRLSPGFAPQHELE